MTADFYRSFEDKHRGPRDLITNRLRVYLPFIELMKQLSPQCCAVDLGCGRGEWLELISSHGIQVTGVDLDDQMLADCHELGLSVITADAIDYLQSLPDESQNIISGFHIVEHLPFNSLQKLVSEALRVLRPAGLLILETPNPENIAVGTDSFYLDPTHIKPIPSQLLNFLPEYCGYYRSKILRLQEPEGLLTSREPTILDILKGVSPDYAVIAQKQAEPMQLQLFDEPFQHEYGLSLATIAMRYETNNQANIVSSIELANEAIRQSTERAQNAEQQLCQQQQHFEQQQQCAETLAHQLQLELQAVYSSSSWRVTEPLRRVVPLLRQAFCWPFRFFKRTIKSIIRLLMSQAILFVVARPRLKSSLNSVLGNYPHLDAYLRRFAVSGDLIHPRVISSAVASTDTSDDSCQQCQQLLSPHARRIYTDLKKAIDTQHQHGGN